MADDTPGPAILVIDDEEVIRMLFKTLLEQEGYTVLLAANAAQGVKLLNQHRPPVAVVDKNLPDGSGLDLIAEQKKKHPATEFIVITAYSSLDAAVQAMKSGAFSYATKPFNEMEDILSRIRSALNVHTARTRT
jgi:two-component system NtrC family response regulator